MIENDAFATNNSGLNAFLFAEVGIELNGSPLTILSTLARLDNDPWAQAAEWAEMPNAISVACLTRSIVQMPLNPVALAQAGATSARLVRLLPRQSGATRQPARRIVIEFSMPEWLPRAVVGIVFGLAMATGAFIAVPVTPVPHATTEQMIGYPR